VDSATNKVLIKDAFENITNRVAELSWDLEEPSKRDLQMLSDEFDTLKMVAMEFLKSDAPRALKELAEKTRKEMRGFKGIYD